MRFVVILTTLFLLLGPVKAQGINPVTPAANDLIPVIKPAFANPSNSYTTPTILGSVNPLAIGTTPITGGVTGDCIYVNGQVIGQQVCGPSLYLGLTATRGLLPNASAGSNTWTCSRNMHWSRDTIVNPTLIYPNFYLSGANTESNNGTASIKASIEYPAGTFIPSTSGTVSGAGGTLIAITFSGVTIPNNTQFWTRPLQQNASGAIYMGFSQPAFDPSEGFEFGTGAPTDCTTGGSVPQSSNRTQSYMEIAIVSQTTRPSVCGVGDSRQVATEDTNTTVGADVGEIARIVAPKFAYTIMALGGTTLAGYLSGTHTGRSAVMAYCSHIVNSYGINDGSYATTLVTNRAAFAALYPNNIVVGTTLYPSTGSSDNYLTKTNQSAYPAGLAQFNSIVRSGITGERFYLDGSDGIDPYRQNLWPVARDPETASVTAATFTGVIAANVLTASAVTGTISNGAGVIGTGVQPGTVIAGLGSGTGSAGTYYVSISQTVSSTSMSLGEWGTPDGLHASAAASELEAARLQGTLESFNR